MSLVIDEETKKLAKRSGVDAAVVVRLRESFPNSEMHKLLLAAVESMIEIEKSRLETCEAHDLKEIQGTIKGLRRAAAIFNKQKD